jgi:hypothetical protein
MEMYIKYTVYSKPFYAEYLQKNGSKSFPLYQGEIFYVNSNTNDIVQISKDQHTLNVLFLLGIIFSSIFLVVFVSMLVMYRRSRRSDKFKEENKSLLTGDVNSNAGSMFDAGS